jgi:L-aminopeptidase/D-esterase-like protein
VITRVRGIRVGHWTDRVGLTGCTVILCPSGTVGSCEVRGGAPGTRETDALRPGTLVEEVHAVLLTGGSAFGLAAAGGIDRYCEERGIGFDAGVARVPIIPAAVLFDLAVGDATARPGPEAGYAACKAATDGDVEEGTVGAGTGATVAKLPDPAFAVKGGIGTAAAVEADVVVGAIAAVNSMGEIVDDEGVAIAANRSAEPDGEPRIWPGPSPPNPTIGTNTTLAVVATNARMSKERAHLLAIAAHEGIERAVRPAHTIWDGDTTFALATGEVDADQRAVESMAVAAVAEAIHRAVLAATGVPDFPAVTELGHAGEVQGR